MKFRSLVVGLCQHSAAGILLVAGAIGVVAAARYVLRGAAVSTIKPAGEAESKVNKDRAHYFRIRRTQSELGYAYWVLRGYGDFRCFELYDTWREACDEALRRTQGRIPQPPLVFAAAGD